MALLPKRNSRVPSLRILYSLVLLALAGLAMLSAPRGEELRRAQPVAEAAGGSLSVWNTRAGEAILRAERMAPGDSTSGVVTIGNAGEVRGFFALAEAGLDDKPGPNGGRLSERLDLVVSDVTHPGAPVPIYSGKLGDMTSRPLGQMAPGQARTFRFTATLPEGSSALGGGGDNAVAGASTAVSYRWVALAAPPPATAAGGASGVGSARSGDRRPPRLSLSLPRGRRWLAGRRIVVNARCDEPCAVSGRATLRVGRRTHSARLPGRILQPGRGTRIAIAPSAGWRSAARLALRGRRRAQFTLTATAYDAAVNWTRVRRTLRLVPAR